MYRWDVINHLIKRYGYKSYLEIGYYKGWSFDRIELDQKTAVDPNPSKTPLQESLFEGDRITLDMTPGHILFKTTSDKFFANLTDSSKWDIIFIDGLHESKQVDKDIINALKHLNPGGTIVMHDCNPPTELHITGTPNGEWCGDVYKSFCRFKATHLNEVYVIDTDYGVGVIKSTKVPEKPGFVVSDLPPFSYAEFANDRKGYLNLISVEEFLKGEQVQINQLENA